jgi:hypothetical protein
VPGNDDLLGERALVGVEAGSDRGARRVTGGVDVGDRHAAHHADERHLADNRIADRQLDMSLDGVSPRWHRVRVGRLRRNVPRQNRPDAGAIGPLAGPPIRIEIDRQETENEMPARGIGSSWTSTTAVPR